MSCLSMNIELAPASVLLVSALAPGLTADVECLGGMESSVTTEPQSELTLTSMDEPKLSVEVVNDGLVVTLSEICSVISDPMTVLSAIDGILYASNGDYLLLDDEEEE